MNEIKNIKDMIGMTFDFVNLSEDETEMLFVNKDITCKFYHEQDCCEGVYVQEIHGDLGDLQGSPLLLADEVISYSNSSEDSCTWTFCKFGTIKGSVTIRWVGTSNDYYSESVNFKSYKTTIS